MSLFGRIGDGPTPTANKDAPKMTFGTPHTTQQGTVTTAAAITSVATTATEAQKAAGPIVNLSTATKTTDSQAANQLSSITFSQLEEQINKWQLEIEEQEKTYINQATQLNAWDKLVLSNEEKITAITYAVQKVKTEQQAIEQELEFIATQQDELEESITPLQKDFLNMPQVDMERSQIYLLVENLDTQIKQMSEELKEVIHYLNETNKNTDKTDPMVQIGQILNAHMNSLQWIESSTSEIASKLDYISKMHESLRRDSERSYRLTYD